jgi:acyl carrier protein
MNCSCRTLGARRYNPAPALIAFERLATLTSTSEETLATFYREVQSVLNETLSLGKRAYELKPDSPLFGALPELDSQAVLNVLLGLEERFGISIADDDVSADAFTNLRTLTTLVARTIANK